MGLLLQTFAIFTLTSLGLTIVGIKYAFTVAVFAAFINVIPYIGPFIGSMVAILVGLTTAPVHWTGEQYGWLILQIASVAGIVHLIDNILLQPLIFSKSVKAHPLEIFVAIFAGAALAGVVGMVSAIPVYTVLRVSFVELTNGYKRYHVFGRYQKR
jgi:predicted PurR-regulated permease PerM